MILAELTTADLRAELVYLRRRQSAGVPPGESRELLRLKENIETIERELRRRERHTTPRTEAP